MKARRFRGFEIAVRRLAAQPTPDAVPTRRVVPESGGQVASSRMRDTPEVERLREEIVESLDRTDRLSVILHELTEARADNRESLSAMLTLLTAMAALFGVMFYVIFGTDARDVIPALVWAFVPAIPFGLTGFLIYVGKQGSLRSEYMLRLERLAWQHLQPPVSMTYQTSDRSGQLSIPSYAHLLQPLVRTNNVGNLPSIILTGSGIFCLLGSLSVLTIGSVQALPGLGWRLFVGAFYAIYLLLATHQILVGTGKTDQIWDTAVKGATTTPDEHMSASPEQPLG